MLDQTFSDIHTAIEQSRSGVATLWEYSASLSELSIRITWLGKSENIHFVCNGCARIEASASWSNVDFECQQSETGEFRLIDQKAKFLLLCKQIRVFRNLEPLFIAQNTQSRNS